jgi:hypothetical protein
MKVLKFAGFVRHGAYNRNPENGLLDYGRVQIENTGRKIRDVLGGTVPFIFSSTSPRCVESAEVLRTLFGVETVVTHESLDTSRLSGDMKVAFAFIRLHDACEAFIVVGHHDCFEDQGLAVRYIREVVGVKGRVPLDAIEHGDGFLVDALNKTVTLISGE